MLIRKMNWVIGWLLLLFVTAFADVYTWETYTNMYDIRDMEYRDGQFWAATSGGVFLFSPQDLSFRLMTNIDGILDMDCQSVEIDTDGDIWVGTFSGQIFVINPENYQITSIDDYDGHCINDIKVLGQDSLLIAFDDGIGLYVKSALEVRENYYRLGEGFDINTNVNSIFVDDQDIWAATDIGLAKASLSSMNLKDPQSWENYGKADGLTDELCIQIQKTDDLFYALTAGGVYRFSESRWELFNTGIPPELHDEINDIYSYQDVLYATARWGVYEYNPSETAWTHPVDNLEYANIVRFDGEDKLWVGRKNLKGYGGLAGLADDGVTWENHLPLGPPTNQINDVAVDTDGLWWCATNGRGILKYDGAEWLQLDPAQGLSSSYYLAVDVDGFGQVWAGSQGGGLSMIAPNGEIQNYQSDKLAGSVSAEYIIINDVAVDDNNNVWMVNRLVSDRNVLVCRTPNNEWYYFQKTTTNLVGKLALDDANRVWIGTDNRGVYVLDYGQTVENIADDNFNQGLSVSDGLWSNEVKALAYDNEGTMWIGTAEGLNYWYSIGGVSQVDSFYYSLISSNITALSVDAQNNVWVGTGDGISMLPANDRFRPINFTTDNSPLVSNVIQSLFFDGQSGQLFICTPNGLSVLNTGLTAASSDDFSDLRVFPNPFRADGTETVYIASLARDAVNVKIFTSNGVQVKDIPLDESEKGGFGAQALWDGRNDAGELVASGVYLIFAYTEDGQTHVDKVALIRE
ncbi:hypothetical protein KAH55_07240 [bacterium]|nr:hypothetical protein [bacterium]